MPSEAAKKRQAQKRERNKASSRGAQKKANSAQETVPTNGGEASACSPSVSGTTSSLAQSVAEMKLPSASASASARSCTGKVGSFFSKNTLCM